jgi:hypothetical protein
MNNDMAICQLSPTCTVSHLKGPCRGSFLILAISHKKDKNNSLDVSCSCTTRENRGHSARPHHSGNYNLPVQELATRLGHRFAYYAKDLMKRVWTVIQKILYRNNYPTNLAHTLKGKWCLNCIGTKFFFWFYYSMFRWSRETTFKHFQTIFFNTTQLRKIKTGSEKMGERRAIHHQ